MPGGLNWNIAHPVEANQFESVAQSPREKREKEGGGGGGIFRLKY